MNAHFFLLAQQATGPAGFLEGLEDGHRFVLILVAMGFATAGVIALIGIGAGVWHSVRQKQIEADLKQDMLDRGMTAEEIEQVVSARPKEGFDHWMEVWAKKKR